MKNYFIRLFKYNRYANLRIADAINQNNRPENAVGLMAHLLTAEEVWLNRCLSKPAQTVELWPAEYNEDFDYKIDELHHGWITYISSLSETDFETEITYTNLAGDPFITRLDDILAHVLNHGTHTRAQAGQQLKIIGVETLPPTDYIYYVRNLG